MFTDHTFDVIHNQLASAWETHRRSRDAHAPGASLADSSARLYQTRLAMWDWQRATSARFN